MLERYERFVAPSADLVDAAAMERIGARWQLLGALLADWLASALREEGTHGVG